MKKVDLSVFGVNPATRHTRQRRHRLPAQVDSLAVGLVAMLVAAIATGCSSTTGDGAGENGAVSNLLVIVLVLVAVSAVLTAIGHVITRIIGALTALLETVTKLGFGALVISTIILAALAGTTAR